MKDKRLFTPGPTEVPKEVLKAISGKVMHHRKKEFSGIFENVIKNSASVFRSQGEIFLFSSSGTGAMEASVVNLTSPGDKALVIIAGKFGQRWAQLCSAFDVETEIIDCPWGEAVDPQKIKDSLQANPDIKAVFTTLLETSTAVVHPIKEIAEAVRGTNALLAVDAVSGLSCEELETDQWGVDVVVAASHKALMNPPGLGLLCVSDKAKRAYENNARKSYYWDLKKASASLKNLQTPYTPAVNMVYGLDKAIEMILAEGVENVWQRHRDLAGVAREALQDMGLELFSTSPSNGLTAVKVPEGKDCKKILTNLEENARMVFAGGQSHLKGKIIRIAHMGWCAEKDLRRALDALKKELEKQ